MLKSMPNPKAFLRLFLRNNLARQKITSNNREVIFMLVLKDILGGSLKITPENSNNLARQKIASKESLGI